MPCPGFFNWTMTYRLDSDIPKPYGWIEPRRRPDTTLAGYLRRRRWPPYDRPAFLRGLGSRGAEFRRPAKKPKLVAWIVSRCSVHSGRERYFSELNKYVPIDVMGGCSRRNVSCSPYGDRRRDNCTLAVRREYKFYLSFENAICDQVSGIGKIKSFLIFFFLLDQIASSTLQKSSGG